MFLGAVFTALVALVSALSPRSWGRRRRRRRGAGRRRRLWRNRRNSHRSRVQRRPSQRSTDRPPIPAPATTPETTEVVPEIREPLGNVNVQRIERQCDEEETATEISEPTTVPSSGPREGKTENSTNSSEKCSNETSDVTRDSGYTETSINSFTEAPSNSINKDTQKENTPMPEILVTQDVTISSAEGELECEDYKEQATTLNTVTVDADCCNKESQRENNTSDLFTNDFGPQMVVSAKDEVMEDTEEQREIYDLANRNGIALEDIKKSTDGREVVATVLVLNECYVKHVGGRHSITGWTSYKDTLAQWVESVDMGKYDRFRLEINLEEVESYRMELALFCNQHWDNNEGRNHVVSYTAP